MPQADGKQKNRPALILREMPGYGDILVCGVSTQLRQTISGFDEVIVAGDEDFASSGLLADSVIRLGFLAVLPRRVVIGSIGDISIERYSRLIDRLARYLRESTFKK